MLKKLFTIITFFFILVPVFELKAQYLPKDGAKLNYNQVKFSFPRNDGVKNYTLTISIDSTQHKNDFSSYLFKKIISKSNELIVTNLEYGKKYKWIVESSLGSNRVRLSDIHFFSLYYCPYADTSKYKFVQHYNQKGKYQNGIIYLDHMHCAIDRNLNVVWFLPPLIEDFKEEKQIRDFRIYKDGTITFLSEGNAYHINRDADILWKAPDDGRVSGEKRENYHHSFEWLDNGNYLVLGNQIKELEKVNNKDTVDRKIEFTTIIEYNKNKDVIWSWKMLDFFPLDLLANEKDNTIYNTHCNSISFLEDRKKIILGFRDISRIIIIDKTTGKILESYGKKLNKNDTTVIETSLFSYPHDAKFLNEYKISILNNNDCKNGKISSYDIYQISKSSIKILFSFPFNYDSFGKGKSHKLGNAQIITKNNFLINHGAENRITDLLNKSPIWDLSIKKNYGNSGWSEFPIYRIFFIKTL